MFEPVYPFAVINFSIFVSINSLTLRLPIHKISTVIRRILKIFIAKTVFKIIFPGSLINSRIIINHNSNPVSFVIIDCT